MSEKYFPKQDVIQKYIELKFFENIAYEYSLLNELFQLIKMPYDEQLNYESKWFSKRPKWAKNKTGCSMLSCSS